MAHNIDAAPVPGKKIYAAATLIPISLIIKKTVSQNQ
jgi:hypothetical protein